MIRAVRLLHCLFAAALFGAAPAHAFLLSYGSTGSMTGDHKKFMDELVHSFRLEHPEVNIEVRESTSYLKPIIETMMSAIGDGSPDVAVVGLVEWPILRQKDLLNPLSVVLSGDELARIRGALRPELTGQYYGKDADGAKYALPFNRAYPILYVNASLLPQLKGEVTWKSLAAALERERAKGGDNVAKLKLTLPLEDWIWEYVLANRRGQPTLAGTRASLADEATRDVVKTLRELRAKGLVDFVPTMQEAYTDFTQGTTAGAVLSFSSYTSVGLRADFKFRILMPPRFERKETILGGGDLVLPRDPKRSMDTKTREDMRAFVKWFYLGKGAAVWSKLVGYLPVTKAAAGDGVFRAKLATRPPEDKAVYLNAGRWRIGSFYRLDRLCNVVKARKAMGDGAREALLGPEPDNALAHTEAQLNVLLLLGCD
ncbi:MAG: extracellular solute-binding protein [Deltaproteobacteria bacterium]|nr:extracellular solute-binding protein [Deltaproteobacteria bacterium]